MICTREWDIEQPFSPDVGSEKNRTTRRMKDVKKKTSKRLASLLKNFFLLAEGSSFYI